ncbi:MAG TPA: hypothetical protein VHX61_12150 [Rhizomicrobium sp.]|jgi:hypothetical protein|nr:hypothetical protein [Rhizomicrobium sp.]
MTDEDAPERLPPPPFWRTRYFAFDVLPRRPELDPLDIRRIISQPERRIIQRDGRIRLYGFSESLGWADGLNPDLDNVRCIIREQVIKRELMEADEAKVAQKAVKKLSRQSKTPRPEVIVPECSPAEPSSEFR